MNSGYILKTEWLGFADRLSWGMRERELRDDTKVSGLNKLPNLYNKMEKTVKGACLAWKFRISVWTGLSKRQMNV